jgi:hypothetical protein
MSIVAVHELAQDRSGPVGEKGVREYIRTFQVQTDSNLDGPLFVRLASGIPRRGEYYLTATESDFAARVKRVTPTQDDDNPKLWKVQVEYSTDVPDEDENPLNRPAEITWGFNHYRRQATEDIYGKPLLNSVGEHFDPLPMMDDSRPTLTVVRNEASFNPSLAIAYQDAINSTPFLGFAPGQAKVIGISASSQVAQVNDQDFVYWRVQYDFEFCREGHLSRVLDQGRYRRHLPGIDLPLKANQIPRVAISDAQGNPVTDPVPLNGAGLPVDAPNPSKAKYLSYEVYKNLPFTVFGF